MQTRSRLTFRQLLFAVFFLTAFLALVTFLFTYRRDEHLFENITTRLFQEEMTANTLNMHYTIADPSRFGIHDYEAVLPCYSGENRAAGQVRLENLISSLSSLNPDKLSESRRYARNLLLKTLENSLALTDYPYFDEPLSPSSGIQAQLPILLAEYTFRGKQDIVDYLQLLDQTDEYFESLLSFEQEKAEKGLLMASSSLQKVITQCETILDKGSLEEESHFLQSTFRERLIPLIRNHTISLEQAQKYVVLNNRLLSTVMKPAYEALADGLCLLGDDSIPLSGLASHDGGANYYELLLLSQTGSYRSIPEIEELLLDQLAKESAQISGLLEENPGLAHISYEEEITAAFPYQSPAQMLSDLRVRMQADFPDFLSRTDENVLLGSEIFEDAKGKKDGAEETPSSWKLTEPQVTIKTVSESLQDYCAPAFYLTPPIDDSTNNVIYINPQNEPNPLEFYTTLAHEGYPGHLYQTYFYNSRQDTSAATQARELLWYGGYLEGWALYVEFLSFDYASQILLEQNEPLLSAAVQIEKHNRSLLLCLYSFIDMLVHHENASQEQIANLLESFGITGEDTASAIYETIIEDPANYPKYYLGYLEILKLRQLAQELWKENYSDYAFHSFFLEAGPSDFWSLRELLEKITASAAPGKNL